MLEIFSRFLALSLSFSCSHADADSEICPKNTVYIRGKSDSQESNHVDFEVGHIQTLFSIDENALALLCIIHLVLSYFSLLYRQTHLTTIQEEGILALFHTGSKY